MNEEFAGKTAIVTGAASGIGAVTARRLADAGASVLAVDVDASRLDAFAKEQEGCVVAYVADLTVQEAVEAAVSAAIERWGGLDILVNNAGIGGISKVAEVSPESWRRIMAIDLDAVFFACRVAMPHLVKSKGCIVNTASISGIAADYGFTAYNSAKAAVLGLTRVMAIDYARDGVRVNAVSPGFTDTPLVTSMSAELAAEFTARIPMGRAGTPEEMAEAILFLASARASYITGQNLVVDGGIMAHTGQPDPVAFHRRRLAHA